MGLWIEIARVAVVVNAVLLVALGAIWLRNYVAFRSKHTLGLFIFAVLLFLENAFAFYYYFLDPTLATWFHSEVPSLAWRAMCLLHVLETAALLFLAWVTWD